MVKPGHTVPSDAEGSVTSMGIQLLPVMPDTQAPALFWIKTALVTEELLLVHAQFWCMRHLSLHNKKFDCKQGILWCLSTPIDTLQLSRSCTLAHFCTMVYIQSIHQLAYQRSV